jgi:ferritin
MEQALNSQINAELYSSYLYLSMKAYFESINLPGFANWMKVQVQEELMHAMKFFDFVNECRGRVTLKAIEQPPAEWKSPLNVFEETLKHEQKVTGLINNIMNIAIEEKNHATSNFLQWFVNEQVEEEASADKILQQLKLLGSKSAGLFMMDKELGARVFTPPAANN